MTSKCSSRSVERPDDDALVVWVELELLRASENGQVGSRKELLDHTQVSHPLPLALDGLLVLLEDVVEDEDEGRGRLASQAELRR